MKYGYLRSLILLIAIFLPCGTALSATIDRVVAFIDDTAITERDLVLQHSRELEDFPSRTRRQTLEAMINTSLMIMDARRLHLSARDDSELLEKYLALKVRALVLVSEKDIEAFYHQNRDRFGNSDLRDIREEIRRYLEELRLNAALREHISTLRRSASINVLLD